MLWIITAAILAVTVLAAAWYSCKMVFSVPNHADDAMYGLPNSSQYRPFRETITQMVDSALAIPYKEVCIESFDGLQLYAKLYEASPDAPVQILVHGYRSRAERDFCGGLREAVDGGYNVLLIDQRAHGKSEGRYLSFGINESRDVFSWVNYAIEHFGPEVKILLYGMSMGSATVLMATGLALPKNVVGIAADCGYTSPADIIKKVMRDKHYPMFPTYSLVRLGGRLFGGFDIESGSAPEALAHSSIPVLFIHGEEDRFVPCEMSRENFRCSAAEYKVLKTFPNAGHGISYMVDRDTYLSALREFEDKVLS